MQSQTLLPSSPLPDSAPFAAEQIAALNQIMRAIGTEQRAWLSGFLAGQQAVQAPSAAPVRRTSLTILYATESGNAEALAGQARKQASRRGFAARVLDVAETTPAEVASAENLLLIASTWGEGDPPQRAVDFIAALQADDAARFDSVRYAVLALGDRAYARFCATGRELDERLEALGGQRLHARAECDVAYQAEAAEWIDATLTAFAPADGAEVIHVDFAAPATAAGATRDTPVLVEVSELINLNGSRSALTTLHLSLSLEGHALRFEPGDAIGIWPQNDPALVEQLLAASGCAAGPRLRDALTSRLDITTLTRPQLARHAALIGDAGLAALAEDDEQAAEFLHGRQVIDLLERWPRRLDEAELEAMLRPLQPRLYSVASSLDYAPDQADLLIGLVEYETYGRTRQGVASGQVARRLRVGERLPIFVKPNLHFRLPADPARDIIMIGPGTGVAPFRAFLQQREASSAPGRNWLFFGGRTYIHDFLYQLDWRDWCDSGLLSRIDVAFSRDQPEKIYVQHRLWERRAELFSWLNGGAHLYVCGDAGAMARDVHAMLIAIVRECGGMDAQAAEAWMSALRREGRYQRDVY